MLRLYELIVRWHALLMFLVLQLIAFTILVRSNSFHNSTFISSSNEVVGNLMKKSNDIAEYFRYDEINENLAEEIADLKNKEPIAFIRVGNSDFYEYNDTVYMQKWQYSNAHVINKSVHKLKNSITLDRGQSHNFEPDMGVVFNDKIVGIVKQVSQNFSVVMPVINENFRTSVKHKKSLDFGMLENWDGLDPTIGFVSGIPATVIIQKGDSILTSGYSVYFPENILVGFVEEVSMTEEEDSFLIKIKFATEFYSISDVQVIKNILKIEQEELEMEFEDGP